MFGLPFAPGRQANFRSGILSVRFEGSGSSGLERETDEVTFLGELPSNHDILRLRSQSLGCDAKPYTLV